MSDQIIDRLAALIWEYGNDIAGQSSWTWEQVDDKERFRADVRQVLSAPDGPNDRGFRDLADRLCDFGMDIDEAEACAREVLALDSAFIRVKVP